MLAYIILILVVLHQQKKASIDDNIQKFTGETRTMNCGIKATVIAYRQSNDIDVQFENGEIRKHTRIDSFCKGALSPDNYRKNLAKTKYIGKTKLMRCGLKATIIAYKDANNLDVEFEDGNICKNKPSCGFNNGYLMHPSLRITRNQTKGTLFNMYTVHNKAFVFHDTAYFDVSYIDDNIEYRDIMSVQDMKQKLPELAH